MAWCKLDKGDRIYFSENDIKTAIKRNDKKTIAMLIERVDPANLRDTFLHMAIEMQNCEMICFFIDEGCNVNAQDLNGTTPILATLKYVVCWRVMEKLLEAKANMFLEDNNGMNALKMVLKRKDYGPNLIDLFTKHLIICGLNAKELAPLLLKAGWPLHYAIYIGNPELIKLMIEAGFSIDSHDEFTNNMTALHTAIFKADSESTKILLQYGADIDLYYQQWGSPFMVATTLHPHINVKIFEMFLTLQLQRFNTDGGVHSYAYFLYADVEIIKLLIKYKVNFTAKDRFGSTLLHSIVRNRSLEGINLILNTEVDVNNRDIDGNTALHYAVTCSSINCLKALIDKGADVNAKNKKGHTPLVNVIYHYDIEKIIEFLINNGAILDEEMQNHILYYIITLNFRFSCARPILKQMAIMHLQSEPISRRNKDLIERNSNIYSLFKQYCQELHLMKQIRITSNSYISVFDLLCSSKYQLLYYARNKEIVRNFFKIKICSRFPSYGKYIISQFRSACIKQKLTENAIDILSNNIKQLNSNLDITEKIVKFLSPNDLAVLRTNL